MKSPRNRRPRAPSSVLAALGTLQLGALGLLLRGDFMDSLPNLYLVVFYVMHSVIRDYEHVMSTHQASSTACYLILTLDLNIS